MGKDLEFPQEYEDAIASLDWEQVCIDLEQFERDCRYLDAIVPELREQHPDCWVAVYGEEVVGVGADLEGMISTLRAQGIPTAHVALKRALKEPQRLIL